MIDQLGALGEIGGSFFGADGTVLETELPHRTVSAPLKDVRQCATSILLTGGGAKHRPHWAPCGMVSHATLYAISIALEGF